MKTNSVEESNKGKMLCNLCDYNPAVAQCDIGRGVEWLCRRCMEANIDLEDIDGSEPDESLIFCETEWDNQA